MNDNKYRDIYIKTKTYYLILDFMDEYKDVLYENGVYTIGDVIDLAVRTLKKYIDNWGFPDV